MLFLLSIYRTVLICSAVIHVIHIVLVPHSPKFLIKQPSQLSLRSWPSCNSSAVAPSRSSMDAFLVAAVAFREMTSSMLGPTFQQIVQCFRSSGVVFESPVSPPILDEQTNSLNVHSARNEDVMKPYQGRKGLRSTSWMGGPYQSTPWHR